MPKDLNLRATKEQYDKDAVIEVLEIQSAGQGIKFKIDPAMLQELQNAPGFVPGIINIQPMTDLKAFLGIAEKSGISSAEG